MKYIWNMTEKERFKEGMTVGALMAGFGGATAMFTQDLFALSTAVLGLFLFNASGMGLLAQKINELGEVAE